jgi:hypothetical protein
VFAKMVEVVPLILAHPITWLGNFTSAVKDGIFRFAGNIKTHLVQGVMGWLADKLGAAGITLPTTFDISGLLQLVLGALHMDWPGIRTRLANRFGERTAQSIEAAPSVIRTLKDAGPEGLAQFFLSKVGDIAGGIYEFVKDLIVEQVVHRGIAQLAQMLNPAGGFIAACRMIVAVVTFFRDNARRLAGLFMTILDAAADVARGKTDGIAERIESFLAGALRMTISFLATYLRLGDIGEKVRPILERIRKPVDRVIDGIFTAGLKAAGPLIRGVKGVSANMRAKVEQGKTYAKGKATEIRDRLRGGDNSPQGKQQRLDRAMAAAKRVGERFSGLGVGARLLRPLLAAVRVRYGLVSLELFPRGEHWAVRGTVNPTAEEELAALLLLDTDYEKDFDTALAQANARLTADKAPVITAADKPAARRVIAPIGRGNETRNVRLSAWTDALFTYFRHSKDEKPDTEVSEFATAERIRLVNNRSTRFTRLQAHTIDAAQRELNQHYRRGAIGVDPDEIDKSAAYAVLKEQVRGGRGNEPRPFTPGDELHLAKCEGSVKFLGRLEPGLPAGQRAIVERERRMMQSARIWARDFQSQGGPEPPLPDWAEHLREDIYAQQGAPRAKREIKLKVKKAPEKLKFEMTPLNLESERQRRKVAGIINEIIEDVENELNRSFSEKERELLLRKIKREARRLDRVEAIVREFASRTPAQR